MNSMEAAGTKTRWGLMAIFAVIVAIVVLVSLGGWRLIKPNRAGPSSNSIFVIEPYWYEGTWVFDEPSVGLKREPFVAGVPEMINYLVKDIPNAKDGFRLTFSANPFPGHQYKLDWEHGDSSGNFYKIADPPMESWICPAMFRFYSEAEGICAGGHNRTLERSTGGFFRWPTPLQSGAARVQAWRRVFLPGGCLSSGGGPTSIDRGSRGLDLPARACTTALARSHL